MRSVFKKDSDSFEPQLKKSRLTSSKSASESQEEGGLEKAESGNLDTEMGHGRVSVSKTIEQATKNEKTLDTNLYSRQIYAIGKSAMEHLRNSSVLISGLSGVGVEVAKNLILGGVRKVTIHDTVNANWLDLSSQFYLNENDLGQNRAKMCFNRLAELNDSVECTLSTEPLNEEFVKNFELVVLADAQLETQLQVNDWTRNYNSRFINVGARGLFAYLFVDCGVDFKINDQNGEQCLEVLIEHVDKETGNVSTVDGMLHGFEDGDYVTFREVKGMSELNGIEPIKIRVVKPNIFSIGDVARNFSIYTEGGRAVQVKVPSYLSHKSLREALTDPQFLIWDTAHFDQPQQLHTLWQALHSFEKKHGRSPLPRDDADVELMKAELPSDADEYFELLKLFSYQAMGNIAPVASVIGGFAAQEAMKAVTHHMTPLSQFFYYQCIDALPDETSEFDASKLTPDMCMPRGTRYDGQIIVFGRDYHEALTKLRCFIVGAGAIGCELLKIMAVMGIGCDKQNEGIVKITDMDRIEISNLNRQFLFRKCNVGDCKSTVAASSVKNFNSEMRIEALTYRVGAESESVFSDDFYNELNVVLNALDNVDARQYMDRKCVYSELPLLESGTMGTKGNVQIVYPHLTESYSSSTDSAERDIPMCTLRNFPHEIHHTIAWGREMFEVFFKKNAEAATDFNKDQKAFMDRLKKLNLNEEHQLLLEVLRAVHDEKPKDAKHCIYWAREKFEDLFHNTIAQLVFTFPPDLRTEHGVKFWSGTKRCPHPLIFDPTKDEHFNFIRSASVLRALQYGLQPVTEKKEILAILSEVKLPSFIPSKNKRIATTDAEMKAEMESIDVDTNKSVFQLKVKLAKIPAKEMGKPVPIDFEKDDDVNYHMEFVTAASNLRAENYEIEPADFMKTKQIAGRIIPAIATTTTVVAGLAMTELYKFIITRDGKPSKKLKLEKLKNGFYNLALPYIGFSEPITAPMKKYNDESFTLWDRIELKAPVVLNDFLQWMKEKTTLEVTMLSSGVSLVYNIYAPSEKQKNRLAMDMKTAVEEVTHQKVPDYIKALVFEALTVDNSGEDVDFPFIKYII